jgi:hypothetical protein
MLDSHALYFGFLKVIHIFKGRSRREFEQARKNIGFIWMTLDFLFFSVGFIPDTMFNCVHFFQ